MKKIKILIVEDSLFMAKLMRGVVSSIEGFEVCDIAKDGMEGLEYIKKYNPDVVLSDQVMPKLDGIGMIKEIMKRSPKPVIIVSAYTKEGEDTTIKALEAGAVDFIAKPEKVFELGAGEFKEILESKIRIAAKTDLTKIKKYNIVHNEHNFNKKERLKKIVAIAISTGGPRSLQEVIPKLDPDIPAAFLIVQHMPAGFTKSLAERLDALSEIKVKEAEEGDVITKGVVYIAPGGYHMEVEKFGTDYKIVLNKKPPITGLRPAADIMYESISKINTQDIVGVVMTGMGSDGTKGLKMIKEKNNAYIIGQDKDTSIVYGMPRAAAEAGIIDKVVPLDQMTETITTIVGVL
ncbi:MAG: chemotaxis response regulator protein-glutamate methylesterase [Clostridia bacterium]|jgi:two-component system chemotaxis response regulator CheB|nr:chemotaxis response regulator protein-glutamate methylesterase [Clostridia bacterium]